VVRARFRRSEEVGTQDASATTCFANEAIASLGQPLGIHAMHGNLGSQSAGRLTGGTYNCR